MEPSPDARSSHHEARNRAPSQTAIRAAKGRLTACPKSLVATARGPSSHRNVAPIAPLATIRACTQLVVPSIHPYDTARQDYFFGTIEPLHKHSKVVWGPKCWSVPSFFFFRSYTRKRWESPAPVRTSTYVVVLFIFPPHALNLSSIFISVLDLTSSPFRSSSLLANGHRAIYGQRSSSSHVRLTYSV